MNKLKEIKQLKETAERLQLENREIIRKYSQNFVASSLFAFCNEEDVAKLSFCQSVMGFEFLLFLHHDSVGGKFFLLSVLSLKSGCIRTLYARAGHLGMFQMQ